MALLALTGAPACSALTDPETALPVEFRRGFVASAPASGSIDALGRIVVGVMVRDIPCNFGQGASAAVSGQRLVVTITLIDYGPIPCAAFPPGVSADTVFVLGLAPGSYDATLRLRVELANGSTDSTVARQTVAPQ